MLAAVLTAGCSKGSAGGADASPLDAAFVDPRAAICADAGTAAPSFAVVQRIFDDNCLGCHSDANDLILTADVSWGNLVGRPAPESCGGVLVVPGDPAASYLYQKLTTARPCSGTRMPAGEFGPVPLPDCVVGIIRDWIALRAPS